MAVLQKKNFRERLKAELREFATLALYLFICFTTLAAFKAAVLQAYGVSFAPWLFAAIKSVVAAKFLLIGRIFGLGDGLASRYPLIISTLYRACAFLVVLVLLTGIEEIAMGHLRGESVSESLSAIGGGTIWQVIATSAIMLLILIPWFAFRALGEIVGEETLRRLYFEPRPAKPAEAASPIEQQQHQQHGRQDAAADDRDAKSEILARHAPVVTGRI